MAMQQNKIEGHQDLLYTWIQQKNHKHLYLNIATNQSNIGKNLDQDNLLSLYYNQTIF